MSSAKITTVGFYQYMNAYNNDLFGLLNLPPGIDKDTLINNILLRGGEFEVVYSNPDFYKSAIGLWSNKHYRTFEKWINALNIDYNPLENYDRMEEWTDSGSRTNTGTVSDSGTRTNTGTVSDTGTRTNTGTVSDTGSITNTGTQSTNTTGKDNFTGSGNSTSIDEISAYNSSSFQNDKKNTTNSSNSSETNTTTNSTRTDNLTESNSNTRTDNLTESNSNTRTDNLAESNSNTRTDNLSEKTSSNRIGRAHGNIGVTTSQQMLQSELDIAKWNIYEQITDLFLSEFCIMVYV